jgi:hypothetical protein
MGMWVCLRTSLSIRLKKAEHWSLPFYVSSGLAHPLLPTMSKAEKITAYFANSGVAARKFRYEARARNMSINIGAVAL